MKKILLIMIKYHPTFVGWMIYKGLVEKKNDKLVIKENRSVLEYYSEKPGKSIMVYEDGVKRIYTGHWDYGFFQIFPVISYQNLIENGIDIFEVNYSRNNCHCSQLKDILENHIDIVYDMYIPDHYPRFKGKERDNYLKMHYRALENAKKNNYIFPKHSSYRYGLKGDIRKHGIFAIDSIYTRIEWDFDMVEKYKDQIMWNSLIQYSNLKWDMDHIEKYENYFSFCDTSVETYVERFMGCSNIQSNEPDKFGLLSNEFLDRHKHEIDWRVIFENGKIKWNADEMRYFCEYALSIDMPYSRSFMKTRASTQIGYSLERLLDNTFFQWTKDNLLTFLLLRDDNWKAFVEKHRQSLFRLFLSIPNIHEIAEPFVKGIRNFWQIVQNENGYLYDELTPEFMIDNIRKNLDGWSKIIKKEYTGTYRYGKEYYSTFSIVTQWNILMSRKNIPLTYELANYLSGIDIKVGGGYEEDDGGTKCREHTFDILNGLDAFANHHFASINDMEMCIEDNSILDRILSQNKKVNVDIVKHITDKFLLSYSLEEYLEVINNLKDWDRINTFHGEGDDIWLNVIPTD